MKPESARTPANEAMGAVSEVISTLHELLKGELSKAPDDLKQKATTALEASKDLMSGILEHMKGHDDPATGPSKEVPKPDDKQKASLLIAKLQVKGQHTLAIQLRSCYEKNIKSNR